MSMSKRKLFICVVGIGGSGKSSMMRAFRKSRYYEKGISYSTEVSKTDSMFCDPPTTRKFFSYNEKEKREFHRKGLEYLKEMRDKEDKHVVFFTHYSYTFRNDSIEYYLIMEEFEKEIYDVIIYLNFDPKVIHQRQLNDTKRKRGLSLHKIREWSEYERRGVQKLFKNTRIVMVDEKSPIISILVKMLKEND